VSYKPSDLFLGIIDVFVVLLPGAIVIAGTVLASCIYARWLQQGPGVGTWSLLILGSYVTGHLLSVMASFLEDKSAERWPRKERIKAEQKDLEGLRTLTRAAIARLTNGQDADFDRDLRRWAALFVMIGGGDGRTQLGRKDADRRFFRNTTVAFALLSLVKVTLALRQMPATPGVLDWTALIGFPVLALLCLWRYVDQDKKYSRYAYESLVVMESLGLLSPARPAHAPNARVERRP